LGFPDIVFVRLGSTNHWTEASLIEEMWRYARQESFDEQPLSELNSEALDFRVASELFALRRKLPSPRARRAVFCVCW
jgi:predicted HTH transcriptional regulator